MLSAHKRLPGLIVDGSAKKSQSARRVRQARSSRKSMLWYSTALLPQAGNSSSLPQMVACSPKPQPNFKRIGEYSTCSANLWRRDAIETVRQYKQHQGGIAVRACSAYAVSEATAVALQIGALLGATFARSLERAVLSRILGAERWPAG